jgi:hypothetical protein
MNRTVMIVDKEGIKSLCLEKGQKFADELNPDNEDLAFNRRRVAMVYAIGAGSGLYAFFSALNIPTDFIDTKDFGDECLKNGEGFARLMFDRLGYTRDNINVVPMAKDEIAYVYACGAKAVIWHYMQMIESLQDKNLN